MRGGNEKTVMLLTNPTRNNIMQLLAISGWPRQLVVWVPKGQEDPFAVSTASGPLLLLRSTDNKLSVPPKIIVQAFA
jgi:hypothetical protein